MEEVEDSATMRVRWRRTRDGVARKTFSAANHGSDRPPPSPQHTSLQTTLMIANGSFSMPLAAIAGVNDVSACSFALSSSSPSPTFHSPHTHTSLTQSIRTSLITPPPIMQKAQEVLAKATDGKIGHKLPTAKLGRHGPEVTRLGFGAMGLVSNTESQRTVIKATTH